MRALLVLFSYHHNNTRKIAKVFAAVLDAQIRTPQETGPEELQQYDLIHSSLRGRLASKGYIIVDEFNCGGLNTNSFLRYFGGLNKGRPDAEDLKRAGEFALGLKLKIET